MTVSSPARIARILWVVGAITSATTAASVDPQVAAPSNAATDTEHSKAVDFIQQTARRNETAVVLGEIGIRQTRESKLRDFCKQVQQDHLLANKALHTIGHRYGVSLQRSLTGAQEKELAGLQQLSGADFDRELATQLLQLQEQDLSSMDSASDLLQSADLKQYAEKRLTVLRGHFQSAQEVARSAGVADSTISSIAARIAQAVGGTGESREVRTGAGTGHRQ